MPTYEYRCEKCHHRYEKREGFDAPSIQACPQCSGTARRIFHPPPIVFKGSGFYNTDNKRTMRPDVPSKADSDSPASTNGSSAETKTADAKASEPAVTE